MRMHHLVMGAACILLLSVNACAVRRETDGIEFMETNEQEILESGTVYSIDYGGAEFEGILTAFFGKTLKEAEDDLIPMEEYQKAFRYEADGISFSASYMDLETDEEQPHVRYLRYENLNYGLSECYSMPVTQIFTTAISDRNVRQVFPLENLDSCTKEQVLEFCNPLAEALGYNEANVSVYAVTIDDINENLGKLRTMNIFQCAPSENHQVVSLHEIRALEAEGKDTSALHAIRYARQDCGQEWGKKDEVLFVLYQQVIDGYPVVCNEWDSYICYSPYYDAIVFAECATPYQLTSVISENELVSREEALGQALLIDNVDLDAELENYSVSLVYAFQQEMGDMTSKRMIPCWEVQYTLKNETKTVIVDAVNGEEYVQYVPVG